jgi:hypothetical protein
VEQPKSENKMKAVVGVMKSANKFKAAVKEEEKVEKE